MFILIDIDLHILTANTRGQNLQKNQKVCLFHYFILCLIKIIKQIMCDL